MTEKNSYLMKEMDLIYDKIDEAKESIDELILSINHKFVSVALYYTIASPLELAEDQFREAAGGLSGAELAALKDGTLHELLLPNISIADMRKAEAKARIERLWQEQEIAANKDYQKKYRDVDLVGKVFNGTNWS